MSSPMLKDRLAIVTGGGSGIGRATCQLLAKEGAKVIASDKNFATAQETVNMLPDPSKHMALELDISNMNSIESSLKAILDRYKAPPSCLVNNAGIVVDEPFLSVTEESYDAVLNVNLKGTFFMTQAVAKSMIANNITNGNIVNISSLLGKVALKMPQYSASKAGVIQLTKVVARELASKGIRVNCVVPGMVQTNILKGVNPEDIKKEVDMAPLKRIGQPEEIGEAILFLLSDRSSYMTGSCIDVTGGFV